MKRNSTYVLFALIIAGAIALAGFLYIRSFWANTNNDIGELVVNAKAYDGTSWDIIAVRISVDNELHDTPFRYSVVRFTNHVVQAPSLALGNYSFIEWDTHQTELTRNVSIDFESGNLDITAYYSSAEHPSIYTFEDGFETGLSTWTGKLVDNGADPATFGLINRTGTTSCRFHTDATLSAASSAVFKTISTTDDVYARAYIYIAEGITSMQTNDRFYLIRIVYGSTENLLASLGIRRNGTEPPRWCLVSAKNSTSTRTPEYGQTVNASVSSSLWTCLELHWNRTGGVVEAWINGEKQITAFATPDDMSPASNIEFGIYKKGDDGSPPPSGMYEVTVYVDDCIIDDMRIGA